MKRLKAKSANSLSETCVFVVLYRFLLCFSQFIEILAQVERIDIVFLFLIETDLLDDDWRTLKSFAYHWGRAKCCCLFLRLLLLFIFFILVRFVWYYRYFRLNCCNFALDYLSPVGFRFRDGGIMWMCLNQSRRFQPRLTLNWGCFQSRWWLGLKRESLGSFLKFERGSWFHRSHLGVAASRRRHLSRRARRMILVLLNRLWRGLRLFWIDTWCF